MDKSFKHDIAISFAFADRNIALCIYLALKLKFPEIRVYYHPNNQAEMLGNDLENKLKTIFGRDAKHIIPIISKDYIRKTNNENVRTEIQAFVSRYKTETYECIIPIVVDKTPTYKVSKILNGITFFPWNYNPEKLTDEISNRLNKKKKGEKANRSDIVNNIDSKGKLIIHQGNGDMNFK